MKIFSKRFSNPRFQSGSVKYQQCFLGQDLNLQNQLGIGGPFMMLLFLEMEDILEQHHQIKRSGYGTHPLGNKSRFLAVTLMLLEVLLSLQIARCWHQHPMTEVFDYGTSQVKKKKVCLVTRTGSGPLSFRLMVKCLLLHQTIEPFEFGAWILENSFIFLS